MNDTTTKKINANYSPQGSMGQKYLVSGKRMSMRLWEEAPTAIDPQPTIRDYETLGYIITGRAKLEIEGQVLFLEPGDSWLVPKGAVHRYQILETLVAVETTAPPARVDMRDSK